jgi:excisionase family DNA binding protein
MEELVWTGWLTTDEAAEVSGYSVAYMRRLVRQGRVEARKIQREWLVNRESLIDYKDKMEDLGRAKFAPRRSEN